MLSRADQERRGAWARGLLDRIKATDPESPPSDGAIADIAEVHRTALSHWRDGSDLPMPWQLQALAAAFGSGVVLGEAEAVERAGDLMEDAVDVQTGAVEVLVRVQRATSPSSPGGRSVTADEAEGIVASCRRVVGAAGGMVGSVRRSVRRGRS